MPLVPGTRLGPYEILAPLGAGGMGEVFRARDTRLGRDVAVKVLPAELVADADRLGRFEREARAAAALEHPAILNVHDVGRDDGRPYLVSELLEGETLRERLGQGRLPTRKAIEIATQIASGLAAAHDKDIVHRDLKPENVFVTSDGRAKILDFGLARLTGPEDGRASGTDSPTMTRHTDPGSVVGTVGYMSPEQVRGRAVDHRADLFAFGTVLFEMLAGRRAFQGPSSVETMNAILKEDPLEGVAPGTLTPALERIVRHCLEKTPGERFQSAHDLAFDLQALSGTSGESRVRAPARRPRRLVLALAALTALAAAFATGYFAGRGAGSSPLDFRLLTFRRGSVGSARFSPDGRTVFYSAKWGEKMGLFSAVLDSPEPGPIEIAGQLVGTAVGEIRTRFWARRTGGHRCSWLRERLQRCPRMDGSSWSSPSLLRTPRAVCGRACRSSPPARARRVLSSAVRSTSTTTPSGSRTDAGS